MLKPLINGGVYPFIKRILDIFISLILISLLSLPMAIIWLTIRINTRESAIFKQKRVGADGRVFTCYKFRTMYKNAPSELSTSEFTNVSAFITPIGKKLRKSSLDELPQLFNVLLGQMSLVGPRPLIEREHMAHEMRYGSGASHLRPGITGLAQIRGRDMLDDVNKVYLDTEYAFNMGFFLDIRILLSTLLKAFVGTGVRGVSDTYS
jgi:O-antigen biosynthesis protein WbqP